MSIITEGNVRLSLFRVRKTKVSRSDESKGESRISSTLMILYMFYSIMVCASWLTKKIRSIIELVISDTIPILLL